jgi:hypothetical protein
VQGLGQNVVRLTCSPSPYLERLARTDRDRGDAYERGAVFACSGCASAVDLVAEARANAVRAEVLPQIAALNQTVTALTAKVAALQVQQVFR